MLDRLSIYRVESADTSTPRHIDLAQRIFELKNDFEIFETKSNRVLRSAQDVVEIAPAGGGIWAAGKIQLWKSFIRPDLPTIDDTVTKVNALVRQLDLLPKLERPFKYGKPTVDGTYYALRQGGKRENRRLDVQVAHPILVGSLPCGSCVDRDISKSAGRCGNI